MQNSVICTRMTSLYGFQPLSAFFSPCKTVTLRPDLQVCIGPSPQLCFFAYKTATFGEELKACMGPWLHLSFCACKTAWLASESLVSMGPSPYLWILHANQRLLEPNYKSIWVPALICGLCMQNSALWTRIQVRMCTRPHLSFCAYKPAWLAPELLISMCSSPHMWFCAFKTATFGWE